MFDIQRKPVNYTHYALGLMLVVLAGVLLSKVPAVGAFLGRYSAHYWNLWWCCWIVAIITWFPHHHIPGRLRLKSQIMGLAFTCAVFFLALQYVGGFLLQGIAISGYDRSLLGIAFNLWGIFPLLIVSELLRELVIGVAQREPARRWIWIILITLLLAAIQINFTKVITLKASEDWFIYVIRDILPFISQSFLLTVLVYCGGAVSAIIYSGFISVFLRVFPLLPVLPWVGEGALGIVFPAFASLVVWEQNRRQGSRKPSEDSESMVSLGVLLVVSVALVWFVLGVFPIYPSVVLTGSMEPDIRPGDVVLIEKLTSKEEVYSLAVDDVITFQREDIVITHRIVAVHHDEAGNISFETKGDNNKTADPDLVQPNDIKGIVNNTVPKVGLPVIWLRGQQPTPEGVIN